MKKIEEKTNLKSKTVPELKALAKTLKDDMARLFIEKKNRRLQNTMLPSQKKKMFAQVLTILKESPPLLKTSASVKTTADKSARRGE
ncbi:hypothetical protein A3D77_00140 [Candidatus Gottesmanbacteria bacterium RIFCSPHIGHO2_02_FULL_39_11]|uniref:Large ribosomal subunit protein uL29 n=1 Tax=Candidatus Gottesmanbacteria bacterium RIFCSPHIGHO2_02_FULL_39_11 TaxID=1798382 RepID=A0A1F5ZWI3_9BACT|nr:MAG: hypothetical protein A3D77_00140 [Candidatus Gottesmanbacteria bacterium RIFCSPHIGHO2_02_FULL_39_11]